MNQFLNDENKELNFLSAEKYFWDENTSGIYSSEILEDIKTMSYLEGVNLDTHVCMITFLA